MEKNEKIAYDILGSPLKKILLEELDVSPKTATHIKKTKQKPRESISRAFSELKKIGLVKCKNEWHHRYRFYSITEDGKSVLKKIKEIEK